MRHTLAQFGLSLVGGWAFGYYWLRSQRRNREALKRMFDTTHARQEFDFSSGSTPIDVREFDEATGVDGERVTRELLESGSIQKKVPRSLNLS